MRFMPFALPRIPAASREERAAPAPVGRNRERDRRTPGGTGRKVGSPGEMRVGDGERERFVRFFDRGPMSPDDRKRRIELSAGRIVSESGG